MVFIFVRRIFVSACAAFCAATNAGGRAAVSSARVSRRSRNFICAGFPIVRAALERAVSRPGKPESGVPHQTAIAYCGQGGSS